jgi:hypothetical protein
LRRGSVSTQYNCVEIIEEPPAVELRRQQSVRATITI